MRLIDADALNKELQKRVGYPTDDKLYEVNLCIIESPTIEPITEEDLIELRDRFGKAVEAVVRDMLSGEGRRWKTL